MRKTVWNAAPAAHQPVSTCAHVCARVAPCAHMVAPARTRACSWLDCGPSSAAAGDRVSSPARPSPVFRPTPLRLATRLSNARNNASAALYNQLRAAPARSQCNVHNRLECGTCCAPVSTCGHVSARVAPGAHLLAPVRTRGCSWLGCGMRSNAAAPLRRFTCQAVANVALARRS